MVSNGLMMIGPLFNAILKFFFFLQYTEIYLKFHLQSTLGYVNGYNYENVLKSYLCDKEALACTFVQLLGLSQLEKFSAPVSSSTTPTRSGSFIAIGSLLLKRQRIPSPSESGYITA